MFKKILTVILICVLSIGCLITFSGCKNTVNVFKTASYLVNDEGYIDYAKNVYYKTDKYPELKSEGLFWQKYNEDTRRIDEYHATSDEGIALIDTEKPTVIFVHGVLYEVGRYNELETFIMNCSPENFPEHFNKYDEVYTTKFWLDSGFNVGMFHYEHFADAEPEPALPFESANNIWHNEGGLSFIENVKQPNGTYKLETKKDASDYSVAQFFAAEYIRAMNALPDDMGKHEIRIACHSMGGVLTTTGVFLLTELEKAGQIEKSKMPNRISYLDAYISMPDMFDFSEMPIAWSGKLLPKNKQGLAYVEAVKAIYHYGMAIESICGKDSIVNNCSEHLKKIVPYFAYTVYEPLYNGNTFDWHVAVRELYMISIAYPPCKIKGTNEICISASTPIERIYELMGKQFRIVEGKETMDVRDDVFEQFDYFSKNENE